MSGVRVRRDLAVVGWLLCLAIRTLSAAPCVSCPDAWLSYKGSCYGCFDYLSESWSKAKDHCADKHSHLVAIETQEELAFVTLHANKLFKDAAVSAAVRLNFCPDTWITYQDGCYEFMDESQESWSEATHHCAVKHSHLVTIETQEELAFVRDHANRLFKVGTDRGHNWFWIGATDEDIEGVWLWYTNQSHFNSTFWYRGEPQNAGNRDCALIWGNYDYQVASYFCSLKSHFICEMRVGEDPSSELVGK